MPTLSATSNEPRGELLRDRGAALREADFHVEILRCEQALVGRNVEWPQRRLAAERAGRDLVGGESRPHQRRGAGETDEKPSRNCHASPRKSQAHHNASINHLGGSCSAGRRDMMCRADVERTTSMGYRRAIIGNFTGMLP